MKNGAYSPLIDFAYSLGPILTSSSDTYHDRLAVLQRPTIKQTLTGIRHGVERETLRINSDGSLAQTRHGTALGSALTHESITTDFSEALLEFITPPEQQPERTLAQLRDIQRYVQRNIGQEYLWPMSMPCYIDNEDDIPLAQFGSSNIGRMKTLYRRGLKNRYGSMMQAIAGVHYNFSLPQQFWDTWLPASENGKADKDAVSQAYFSLIRNYRRFCWLVPYLFGASPALCGSFVKTKTTTLPFRTLGQGTLYLPYATSLRMSDLGYTNSAQSGLGICYNHVDSYIASLHKAINTPSEAYQKFAQTIDGEFQQLNSNVLQIENELYSPIRPKQPIRPLEKPTDALASRGVSYVEIRALDVDPFSDVGISKDHFYFLDIFLLYCVVKPSALFDCDSFQQTEANLRAVVTHGRDPQLKLLNSEQPLSVGQWAKQLFDEMRPVADILNEVHQTTAYTESLARQWQKIQDPQRTPSGKMLKQLLEKNQDNGAFGLELAQKYRNDMLNSNYELQNEEEFVAAARQSLLEQQKIELADDKDFDEFLRDYFSNQTVGTQQNKSCA